MVGQIGARLGGSLGFSVVDLLVALVILEAAVVAVLGLAVQASRTLALAERTEAATALVHRVADSLSVLPAVEAGRLPTDWGSVEWEPWSGRWIALRALPTDTTRPPLVDARIWIR